MKKTVYVWAAQRADMWDKPSVLSNKLKTAAIGLAFLIDDHSYEVGEILQAVWSATEFLDRIKEMEVEQ